MFRNIVLFSFVGCYLARESSEEFIVKITKRKTLLKIIDCFETFYTELELSVDDNKNVGGKMAFGIV